MKITESKRLERMETECEVISPNLDEPAVLRWGLIVLITAFPVVTLAAKYVDEVCFYLIVLLCIWSSVVQKRSGTKPFLRFFKVYWPLCLAAGSMLIAELLNQVFVGDFKLSRLLLSARFIIFPLIVYALQILSVKDLKLVQWGVCCAAVLSCLVLLFSSDYGMVRPDTGYIKIPVIPYTNLSVMVGFLAFWTIGWDTKKQKWPIVLKTIAWLSVIYGAYLSETRASWVMILVLGLLTIAFFLKSGKRSILIMFLFLLALSIFMFLFAPKFQSRMEYAQSDVTQYSSGKKDTSLGLRLQIYQAAWFVFKEHPVFGVGQQGYGERLDYLSAQGIISPTAAGLRHFHNEFLHRTVVYGIFGAISVILITLIPFFYFFRHVRSQNVTIRIAAFLGVGLNVAFFIAGLSDVIFRWRGTIDFYVVMMSVLLALLMISERENQKNTMKTDQSEELLLTDKFDT